MSSKKSISAILMSPGTVDDGLMFRADLWSMNIGGGGVL